MSLCIPRHMTFRPPKSCGHQAWNPYSWYLDGGLHREVPTSYHLSHRVSATMQSTFRMSYFFKFWFSLHLDGADALDNISISQIKKKLIEGDWITPSKPSHLRLAYVRLKFRQLVDTVHARMVIMLLRMAEYTVTPIETDSKFKEFPTGRTEYSLPSLSTFILEGS